jgi:hypothetical protein
MPKLRPRCVRAAFGACALANASGERSSGTGAPSLVTDVPFERDADTSVMVLGDRRPHCALGFPDDLPEETRGLGGGQGIGAEAVHDLHVMIHVRASFQVESAS